MGDYDLSPKYEISPRYYGHKSSKREEKIFKCKECKRQFNRKHNLTKHERTHSGEKPYPCTECGKRFSDSSNLTKHTHRVHIKHNVVIDDKRPVICEVCQRSFLTPDDFFQHELKYANQKVFTCQICNKSFHLRNSYARHLDIHNEKRKFHCDMCDKTFSQKFLLERHRQYHAPSEHDMSMQLDEEYEYNDEEDHEEEEDGEYASLTSLADTAGTKFEGSDAEGNQRERIGKGITVHECTICNKVFTYRSLFTRHLKSHSTDNSFKCHLCHTVFKRQYYLAKHRKSCKGIVRISESTLPTMLDTMPSGSSQYNKP